MTDHTHGGAPRRLTDEELLAAMPSGTQGREARVGIFVLLGLVSFVIVVFWMTDPAMFRGRYLLVTSVDHAGGVRGGDPVQMQGVTIGRVSGFEMVGDRVDITLEIEGEWPVPRGSRVVMGQTGIFGGRTIEIEVEPSDEYYAEGDTIPGEGATSSGLLGSVDELSSQAGSVLSSLESLLDSATVEAIQGTVQETEELVEQLSAVTNEQRAALSRLTESLQRSAEGIEAAAGAGPDAARAVARADTVMTLLAESAANVDATMVSLRSLIERISTGEGTLGRLTTDDAALYENMNQAVQSLNALLEDLQANPNRYINLSIF